MILGAGASGKSTLTRSLCGNGEEHAITLSCYDQKLQTNVDEKLKYTVCPNGIALAGNLKNGSDSISRMDALSQVVNMLFDKRDIVIVDGVRSSQKFVDWIQAHPIEDLAAVFVYFGISLEANVARLKKRRTSNGKEEELPEKTYNNMLSFRSRAERVWNHARATYKRPPHAFVTLNDHTNPDLAARSVWQTIRTIQ